MGKTLEMLETLITPDMIGKLSKQLGLSDELTRKGLVIANAVLIGGMARTASTPDGAARMAQLIDEADTNVLGNLGSAMTGVQDASNDIARQVFGSNLELVMSGAHKATGIDITPFLNLSAPVVLAAAKSRAVRNKAEPDTIAATLQSEARGLARRDTYTAGIVKEVLKPIVAQEKLKAAFSAEEWNNLQQGPLNAAALVMLADHSGGSGRGKELDALRRALAEAAAQSGPTGLVGLIYREGVADSIIDQLVKAYRKAEPAEVHSALLTPIAEALTIARTKASKSDASTYQGLLITVAQQVAGASKEGGFLGMGGEMVSSDEKAAIDALVSVVRTG